MSLLVRSAKREDLPAILSIYNEAVLHSTAIWNWQTVDLANREAWLDARVAQGYPVLVADDAADIVGYGSFGEWRAFDGYRHTIEHSIYVAPARRRGGVGSALLLALIEKAQSMGKHVMLGGIAAENEASIALHRRFGFVETAHMPEVGRKFERWLDLVFMQKIL